MHILLISRQSNIMKIHRFKTYFLSSIMFLVFSFHLFTFFNEFCCTLLFIYKQNNCNETIKKKTHTQFPCSLCIYTTTTTCTMHISLCVYNTKKRRMKFTCCKIIICIKMIHSFLALHQSHTSSS